MTVALGDNSDQTIVKVNRSLLECLSALERLFLAMCVRLLPDCWDKILETNRFLAICFNQFFCMVVYQYLRIWIFEKIL